MAWKQWQLDVATEADGKLTAYQIGDKVGKEPATVRRYLDNHKIPYLKAHNNRDVYTDQQIKEVEDALAAGDKSHAEIAKMLSVNKSLVSFVSCGRRTRRGAQVREVKNAPESTAATEAFKKVFG
ncbi:hypothetical protein VPHPG9A1_0031 [Vibrio phage PG9A-1]